MPGTGMITGIVSDYITGKAIAGAVVHTDGTFAQVITGLQGEYSVVDTACTMNVYITHPNYYRKDAVVVIEENIYNKRRDFKLKPKIAETPILVY